MSEVQSVIFDQAHFDAKTARAFLRRNNMVPIKRVHKTKNTYRYRITEPVDGARYRIKPIETGVKFVIQFK